MQINSPAREFFLYKKRGIGREGITNASEGCCMVLHRIRRILQERVAKIVDSPPQRACFANQKKRR